MGCAAALRPRTLDAGSIESGAQQKSSPENDRHAYRATLCFAFEASLMIAGISSS